MPDCKKCDLVMCDCCGNFVSREEFEACSGWCRDCSMAYQKNYDNEYRDDLPLEQEEIDEFYLDENDWEDWNE